MTSLRDLNCGNDVAMMDKLGRFDREFIVYGCAFLRENEPYYFVSSRADTIDHFLLESSLSSLYPTPAATALSACSIPAGTQSALAKNAKLELAKQLAVTYRPAFWQQLRHLTDLPASNASTLLIEEHLGQLSGCFESAPLQLAAGLLRMAFAQKTLTLAAYQNFMTRLDKKLRQMEDDVVIKKTFRRTFSGFSYHAPGRPWQYFYDGEPSAVRAKQRFYFGEGYVVTPMVQRVYWFDGQTTVQTIARRFEETLPIWFDADLLTLTDALWQLPAPSQTSALSPTYPAKLNQEEQAALRSYAYCYRLSMSQP